MTPIAVHWPHANLHLPCEKAPTQPEERLLTTKIKLDACGDSQVFSTTREVRNSDHANATLAEGELVYFFNGRDGLTLAYAETGEPTNGNQYAVFQTLDDAEQFIARAGLVPRERL